MSMKSSSKLLVAAARTSLLSATVVFAFTLAANAQTFSSGSDGSDGAYEPTCTPTPCNVNFVASSLPGDQHTLNIFNFTTVTIPAGVTVELSGNINGPVYWLASGDVDIEGTIDLSGQAGYPVTGVLDGRRRSQPGPGGYSGGVGGKEDQSNPPPGEPVALPGDGPGGGGTLYVCYGGGGTFTGTPFLLPLVGGSGGGGGNIQGSLGSVPYGAGGGAGGGALLIASSTTITVNGTINANGGAGVNLNGACGLSGGGSGGAIRVAVNTLSGSGTLMAAGGVSDGGVFNGGPGVVRIEAYTNNFTGSVLGTQSNFAPFATYLPTTPPPTITVVSVNGTNLTQPPTGSLASPDVTIDTSSPVTLVVQATGIPDGTVITLNVFSGNNSGNAGESSPMNQSVQTTPLSGGMASATVTFPIAYSLSYVKATWTSSSSSSPSAARATRKK